MILPIFLVLRDLIANARLALSFTVGQFVVQYVFLHMILDPNSLVEYSFISFLWLVESLESLNISAMVVLTSERCSSGVSLLVWDFQPK